MAEQRLTAKETIEAYTEMRTLKPNSSILREVRYQYLEMAEGGDGGPLGFADEKTCREYNYPGYPDEFFKEVVAGMGW